MKKRIISLLLVLSMLLCVLPAASAAEEPKFVSCYLSLNESIDINFKTNVAELPDGYSVKFLVNGVEDNQFITKSKDGCAVYTYVGLTPRKLDTPVTVQIVNESGTAVSEATRSVKQYCVNMLNNDSVGGNLKTLLVDLLNYGAAAQTYFDGLTGVGLVNGSLSAAQAALGTQNNPALEDHKKGNTAGVFKEARLLLDNSVQMVFEVYEDKGVATLKVNDVTVQPDANGSFYFDKLNPAQMRLPVTVQACDSEGKVVDTLEYSIVTYAKAKYEKADEDAALKALVMAMIKYGDSAAAYNVNGSGTAVEIPTATVYTEDFSSMANWGNGEGKTEADQYSYGITDDGKLKIELAKSRRVDVAVAGKQTFDGSKKAVIELDMKVDENYAYTEGTWAFYQAGFALKNGSKEVIIVAFRARALAVQYSPRSIPIDHSLVHRIRIETDPTNATFDLYVDNNLVIENEPYQNSQTSWNSLQFYAKDNNDVQALSAYFDNLKITIEE